MEICADKVRQLRQERNWTQQQLADACALSLRTVQRVEKLGNASPESVAALCAVFELAPNGLNFVPKAAPELWQPVRLRVGFGVMLASLLLGIAIGVAATLFYLSG